MGIKLGDNINITAGLPNDCRYQNGASGPYSSISQANSIVTSDIRYTGLTVNILGTEYWYKDGIGDGDLVEKTTGGGGGTGLLNWTGSTANAVGTYISPSGICAQPNLTFDGTRLGIGAVICQTTTDAQLDINPYRELRLGRSTDNIDFAVTVYAGNNSTSSNAKFSGSGDSYTNNLSGNFSVGTAVASEKLTVDGNVCASGCFIGSGAGLTGSAGSLTVNNSQCIGGYVYTCLHKHDGNQGNDKDFNVVLGCTSCNWLNSGYFGTNILNSPEGTTNYWAFLGYGASSSYFKTLAHRYNVNGSLYHRNVVTTNCYGWREIWDSCNLPLTATAAEINTVADGTTAKNSHTHDDRYYTETESNSNYVSKTVQGTNSFVGGNLIFNDGGTSNIDHIHYDDTTNRYYFNADTSLANLAGTATICATTFYGNLSGTATNATTATNANCLGGYAAFAYLRSNTTDCKTAGNLRFYDNICGTFGTSDDLQIYHNGTHSYIVNTTNDLYLHNNGVVGISLIAGDGGTTLYNAGNPKISTLTTGICVYGQVNATCFVGSGAGLTGTASSLTVGNATNATTANNATCVGGLSVTSDSTVNTVVARNGSGDINARLFRSEYDNTNPTIGYIMTQIDTVSNNYMRPSTPAQFRAAVTDGVYLAAGGTAVCATNATTANNSTCLDGQVAGSYLRSNITDFLTGTLNLRCDIVVETAYRDHGVFGTYDSTKTQHIWSMGTAYRNAANGSSFGNLYGLAYKYNGSAGSHGTYQVINGTATAGWGTNIWTSGVVIGTCFCGKAYDSDRLDNISSGSFLRSDAADTKTSGNLVFNDNVCATFGTSSDLDIYHDGSNSYIDNTTGNLYLRVAGAEYAVLAFVNSCTSLRFNNTERFKTISNGVCAIGCGYATDWIAASDCRLKKCITPISNALSTVSQLCGVNHIWCENDTEDIGLIAQDVEKIIPVLVSHGQPSEEQVEKYCIEDDLLGLKYDKITAILVEAVKEQQVQINELKEDIKNLKNK